MRKPASFYFFKRKPIPTCPDRYGSWRTVADLLVFGAQERLRVEWMVFYYTVGKKNATLTAQHFSISRKTFHKWSRRFKDSKYDVRSLADQSKAPRHRRKWEVTLIQEDRIRHLRNRYPYYGEKKLKILYEKGYSEGISTWKIERVIRRYKLYPDKRKQEKTARKRDHRDLHRVDRRQRQMCIRDRYILTAVDHATKLGYARMYKNKSSRSAADFLYRLRYLVDQPIENLQTDNGSECW